MSEDGNEDGPPPNPAEAEAVRLRETTLISAPADTSFLEDITEDLAVDAAEALRRIIDEPEAEPVTPPAQDGIKLADFGASPQQAQIITQKVRAHAPATPGAEAQPEPEHHDDEDTIELMSSGTLPSGFEEEKTQH